MPEDFSDTEQSIIENMLTTKSHRAIALLLDREITAVSEFILSITAGTDIVTRQMTLEAAPEKRKEKKPKVEMVRNQPVKIDHKPAVVKPPVVKVKRVSKVDPAKEQLRQANEQKKKNRVERQNVEAERKNLRRLPMYKTKVVDYTKLVTVMINRTTAIYVKPGADIEAAKKLYLAKVEAQKLSSLDRDSKMKVTKPAKKVCVRCEKEKVVGEFNKNRAYPDGYEHACKICRLILRKKD